jgi:small subunit ribosomal protein S6e
MVFKINLGTKNGKTYKLESEGLEIVGKKLGEKLIGNQVSPDLEGYEFEITGASDSSGFPAIKGKQGITLQKALLKYGIGMHKKPKGDKKVNKKPKGLRLRKTVRGDTISPSITQINLKVIKEGKTPLEKIFSKEEGAKEQEEKK